MPPRKTVKAQSGSAHALREASSIMGEGSNMDIRSASSIREPVGSCNLRQTTLDACVNLQSANADYIDNIASRISALIDRLRGYSTKGECGGEGEREHEGVLGNLKSDLEDEGVRLGEIQADIAVLEELL